MTTAWTLLLTSLLAAPQFELQAADGEALRGQLVRLSADEVAIEAEDGLHPIATGQVVKITAVEPPQPAEAPTVWVELNDGSSLHAAGFSTKEDQATISLPGGGSLTTPAASVATVRFRQQSEALAAQWREMLAGRHTADLIVLRKDDALDFLEGVVRGVDETNVHFELDGEVIPVRREKVEGLVYYHPGEAKTGSSVASLLLAGGSRLAVAGASIEGDQLMIHTPAGVDFTVPLGRVAGFQFDVVYLSDLEPESVKWSPYFGAANEVSRALARFYRPRSNEALEPGGLQLGGIVYDKGLAVHSRTEMVYRLTERYSTLRAVAGIDDRVRPGGHVRLAIYGDDALLFSADISGRDEPLPVVVELNGAARLKIIVDFGDDLDVADHLDLCEPRLIP